MKRVLALALVMIFTIGIAFAEIDLESMKDKELKRLYEDVVEELNNRGINMDDMETAQENTKDEIELTDGRYVCGEDLEPGTYEINIKKAGILGLSFIEVFENENSESSKISEMISDGKKYRLKLKKGEVLEASAVEEATIKKLR